MSLPGSDRHGGRAGGARAVLGRARRLSGSMVAAALLLAAAGGFVEPRGIAPVVGSAAALAGLVSPLIGYRLFTWSRERIAPGTSHEKACSAFVRATLLSLAVGEGVALFGILAYWLSAMLAALIGVVTLVILAGAIWPTPERLEAFLDAAAPADGDGP